MDALQTTLHSLGIDAGTLRPFGALVPFAEKGAEGIFTLAVPGKEALPLWQRLRGAVPQTGYWPVLLGGKEDLTLHGEMLEDAAERLPAQIIQGGLALDPLGWLSAQKAEWGAEAAEYEDFSLNDYHGEWPQKEQASHELSVVRDFSGFRKPKLYLGLVPATQSWEVPASLKLGGWNDCPPPEVHVSLMKHWAEVYGAEIVCATHDVVEMRVARPPVTRDAALALAEAQFFYCEDIVGQGTETLERLAATLLGGTVWYFWWD